MGHPDTVGKLRIYTQDDHWKEKPIRGNQLAAVWNREVIAGGMKAVEVFGNHNVTDPGLNCTSLRGGQTLDFTHATLHAATTGRTVVVDFTNSSGLTVYGLHVHGPPAKTGTPLTAEQREELEDTGLRPDQVGEPLGGVVRPSSAKIDPAASIDTRPPPAYLKPRTIPFVGVLLSRHSRGGMSHDRAAGKNKFFDLRITGKWQLAGLYSISSENNGLFGCRVDNVNRDGLCALYLGRRNNHNIRSQFTLPGRSGGDLIPGSNASATGFMCSGLYSRSSLVGDDKASIILAGHSNANFMATYLDSGPEHPGGVSRDYAYVLSLPHTPQRSHILIDASRWAMDGLSFTGLQALGPVPVALRIDGAYSNGIAGLHFQAGECRNSRFVMDIGPVDLTHGTFDIVSRGDVNIDRRARLRNCIFRGRLATSTAHWPYRRIDQVPAPT